MSTNYLRTKGLPIRPNHSQPDAELSRLLRRAARSAAQVYRSRVSELDLTARQAAAILALVEEPGATLSRLAETLGADQATASALVDRLLAADLVTRETDPSDRRRAMLHPTAKALSLAKAIAEARQVVEESIRNVLGAGDSAQLADLLTRLADGLERRREAAAAGARA